ncbi:MAG: hypothetical protein IRZ16_13345 [Myxococcaceae bacterium]|nr:hypothetical protein [Myxococcaceae bacterium]
MKTAVTGRWRALIVSGLFLALSACGVGTSDGGGGGGGTPIDEGGSQIGGSAQNGGGGGGDSDRPQLSLQRREGEPILVRDSGDDKKDNDKLECRDVNPKAVAIEGQEAPGTHGQLFDGQDSYYFGFDEPRVNDRGNAAFIATYGHYLLVSNSLTPMEIGGAGIFFWDRDEYQLRPVALAGQLTDVGYLSGDHGLKSFDGPALNKNNQIAFSADGIEPLSDNLVPQLLNLYCDTLSALFQANPVDDSCQSFDLVPIAQRGDAAPLDCEAHFWDFNEVAENDYGDIAFEADLLKDGVEVTVPAAAEGPVTDGMTIEGNSSGIFLWKSDENEFVTVVKEGDILPGVAGGHYCDYPKPGGPWLNNDRVVTFQANCIEDINGMRMPQYEGSIFIWREDRGVELFLKKGSLFPNIDQCPDCSPIPMVDLQPVITDIDVGYPGISDDLAVFKLGLLDGLLYFDVVATKPLYDSAHAQNFDLCGVDGEPLGHDFVLKVGTPSISRDNVIGYAGYVEGWEHNYWVSKSATFSCFEGDVYPLVIEGDKKPVGDKNKFGYLKDESNSNKYEVFLDVGNHPTGVFTSDTIPQL